MRRLLATLAVTASLLAGGLPHGSVALAQAELPWLVMLYQNADDEVLEGDIFTDLNEAELVGSSDEVTIVSQLDRYDGAFDGDGDWTTAKRFLLTQDDDLSAIGSEEIEDLGEVDSGAPETLVDFAVWAMTTFPAQRYALILSDHGAGWVGGWNDDAPDEGSSLTINEIDQALEEIAGPDRRVPVRAARLRRLPHEPGRGPCRDRTLRRLCSRLGGDRAGDGLGIRRVPG